MAFKKVSLVAFVSSLAVMGALALGGCSAGYSGGVAATVNGTNIAENTVTDYITEFRNSSDLTDDAAWSDWMAENGMTAEDVRDSVIDHFVQQELMKQLAKDNDVKVDSELVDQQVAMMRVNYTTEAEWLNALKAQGFNTEQDYRSQIEESILEQELLKAVVKEPGDPKKSEILEMLEYYGPAYSGMKRSSHILFAADDKKTAKQVLADIKAGKISFEDAAKKYSKDGSASNGGDVGWDLAGNFVEEYTAGLEKLSQGEVSGLVTSQFGIHIIKCTEEFNAPEKATSLKQYPDALVDEVKTFLTNQGKADAFEEWYEEQQKNAEIVKNPMPSDVPYNVTVAEDEDADADESADEDAEDSSDEDAEKK